MNFTDLYKKIRTLDEAGPQGNAGDDAAYAKYADHRAKGDMLNKEINGENDSVGIKTYTSPQLKNVVSDMTTGLAGNNPELEKRYTMNKLTAPAPANPYTPDELEEGPGQAGQAAQPVSPAMARVAAAKAAGTLPTAPVGLSTTNTGNIPGAQPVGGSSAAMSNPVATKTNIAPGQPLPANAGAVKGESMGDQEVEECGPMGPSGMMGMRDQQPDNVSMNLSMNGQGPGGIRDLLNILKDIGDTPSAEPDVDADSSGDLELDIRSMSHPHDEPNHGEEEDGLVFGNDMEEEYANVPNEMYSTVDDVTNIGSNDGRGDNERPKVNGGGNPYAVTSEGLKRQLQNLYHEVKSR